jgi:pimeloyl-ACP methyl ester carboxylesterase
MATAHNGDVELYYETFGRPGSRRCSWSTGSGRSASTTPSPGARSSRRTGYQVVRFDNRDVGLSSQLDGQTYSLPDMAGDAVAVLDAVGAERAHVHGVSMGGMIVQWLAIDHADGCSR